MSVEVAPPGREPDHRARIVVAGVVDQAEVEAVVSAVRSALGDNPAVEIDVEGVEGFESGSMGGLADCARLGPGVEFRMRGARSTPSRAR